MNPAHVRTAQQACDTLVLTAIPGADGHLTYYEDDGISQKYDTEYTLTQVSQKRTSNSVTITVAPRTGKYEGMKATRSLELRFPCTRTPSKVAVNGMEIGYSRFPEGNDWTYEAYTLCPIVYLNDVPTDAELTVELTLPEGRSDEELYGLQKTFLRCKHLSEPYKNEQGMYDRRLMLPIEYLKVSQCPNFIMEDPQNIFKYVDDMKVNLQLYSEYLKGETPLIGDAFKCRLVGQITEGK